MCAKSILDKQKPQKIEVTMAHKLTIGSLAKN